MVLALGEILFDELPDGRRPGGAPFNFAQHLQRMGRDVCFVSCVGLDPDGNELLNIVQNSGLDTTSVQISRTHATGRVQVEMLNEGIPSYNILPDVAYDHIDFTAVETPASLRLIYFGSLIQRTRTGRRKLHDFLNNRESSILRLYDMNLRIGCELREIIEPSLEQCDILKINDDELDATASLLNISMHGDTLVRELMRRFSIATVALTLGPKGSILYTKNDRFEQKAEHITREQVVDTVGAGDSFTAVLAYGILNQLSPKEILRKATWLSEQVCTIAGAVPADDSFYEKMKHIPTL